MSVETWNSLKTSASLFFNGRNLTLANWFGTKLSCCSFGLPNTELRATVICQNFPAGSACLSQI